MPSETVTRADLADEIVKQIGLSRELSATLVEEVLNELSEAFARGESAKISTFGTFSVRSKTERIGRNPKTGQEVPITERRVVTFRASQLLKQRVAARRVKK